MRIKRETLLSSSGHSIHYCRRYLRLWFYRLDSARFFQQVEGPAARLHLGGFGKL